MKKSCINCKFAERDKYGQYQRRCLGYGSCLDNDGEDFEPTNTIELEKPQWEAKGWVICKKSLNAPEEAQFLIWIVPEGYVFGEEWQLRNSLLNNLREHQFIFNYESEARAKLNELASRFSLKEKELLVVREFYF